MLNSGWHPWKVSAHVECQLCLVSPKARCGREVTWLELQGVQPFRSHTGRFSNENVITESTSDILKMQDEHSHTKSLKDVFSPQTPSRVDPLGSLKRCSQAQEQKNMLKKAFAGAWCPQSAFLGEGQGLYRCMPDGHGYTACVDKHNISKSFLVFLGQPSRGCLRFLPCTSLNSGKF